MDDRSNQSAKLRVLLMQLPVPNNPALNTPLAAGYLKAYASAQGLDGHADIELLPRHLADFAGDAPLVEEIVARSPDVLGVSLYTWNSERSLDVVRRVKEQIPELRVVVGGPEVQKDNTWVLEHPAVDVAVIGEGEQTFADLLRLWSSGQAKGPHIPLLGAGAEGNPLEPIAGIAYRHGGMVRFTGERVSLNDLSVIPSPYLAGYLDVPEDGMLMVEVSRWCPYSCSFCLYGRNMGAKLGNRYFGLERVLAEIRWGRERGIRRVHFVEANLNLVPLFWPLMRALADLNDDGALALYAELRGEHLTDESVAALARAGLRVAEVGLQTANPAALKVAHRKTDLGKWAAGTRRLARQGVEIYLDVILGLPADDTAGVAATLDFIRREDLGPYDAFTLQVLPGTETRRQVAEYGLIYQDRPPYYILATDRFDYGELRRLRRELKHSAGLDPDEVEGCPPPRLQIADCRLQVEHAHLQFVEQWWLLDAGAAAWAAAEASVNQLARHVDVVARWQDAGTLSALLASAILANPSTLFDCYLIADTPPPPQELRDWRAALPYQPGYLDRVAVYRRASPEPEHDRVSPRCFLLLPWTAAAEPADYHGIAEVVWRFELGDGDVLPLNAWYGAGGAGICLFFGAGCTPEYRAQVWAAVQQWQQETGRRVWGAAA